MAGSGKRIFLFQNGIHLLIRKSSDLLDQVGSCLFEGIFLALGRCFSRNFRTLLQRSRILTSSASSETFPDALSDSEILFLSQKLFHSLTLFTVSEAVSVWAAVWVSDSAAIQAKEEDITRADDTRTVATYFFSFPLTILFTSLKPFRVSWQDGLLFL